MALGLKKSFENKGYRVTIHCKNEWSRKHKKDSLVVVLRGLYEYTPRQEDTNFLWLISHPEKIQVGEFEKYNHIFIASEYYYKTIPNKSHISILNQCSDPDLFYPLKIKKEYDLLFIGNSRDIYRKIIKDVFPTNYKIGIIGQGWDNYIDSKYIIKSFVENNELNVWYNKTKILLNDHWDDMREQGFVSNRIFDGLSAGCSIISDKPEGNLSLFTNTKKVHFYTSTEELNDLVEKEMTSEQNSSEAINLNTFDNCVNILLEVYDSISFKNSK